MNTLSRKFSDFRRLVPRSALGGMLFVAACSSAPFEKAEPKASGDGGLGGGAGGEGGAPGSGGSPAAGGRQGNGGGRAGAPDNVPDGSARDGGVEGGIADPDAGRPECVVDSDCVALTCNGEPRCNAGRCDPGLPCANPDAAHCTVTCVRLPDRAVCEVQGKDADGDGHQDVACKGIVADDCNDADPGVNPLAKEVCDGVDNDCDRRIDMADGVTLAGAPRLIHEMTSTASLAMAASPEGYGLAVLQRERMSDPAAKQVEFLPIRAAGQPKPAVIAGDFGTDSTIAYGSGNFLLFDRSPSTSTARVVRVPFSGSPITKYQLARPDSFSVVFSTPSEQFAQSVGAAFVGAVDSTGSSSICTTDTTTPAGCGHLLRLAPPALALAAAYSSGVVAWVESSGALGPAHDLSVMFSTYDPENATLRDPSRLYRLSVPVNGAPMRLLKFMSLRPQVTAWNEIYTVGWIENDEMAFARIGADGAKICTSPRGVPIRFWGQTGSLISFSMAGETRPRTLAVGVSAEGKPIMIELKDDCLWGPEILLSSPDARAALGPYTYEDQAHLEVGHPVIATHFKGEIGVAWVEEPGTNGLHRVMFRSFGTELCR